MTIGDCVSRMSVQEQCLLVTGSADAELVRMISMSRILRILMAARAEECLQKRSEGENA